jgi:hypothetical protein
VSPRPALLEVALPMGLRLRLLEVALPLGLRLWLLDELARVTAEGFGSPRPLWAGLPFETRLTGYARFTAEQAEALLAGGDEAAVEATAARLRRGAAELGAKARRRLAVRDGADALRALAVLYRQIGIEVSTTGPGEMVVGRCLFADYFSEPVCRVVAALDEGIAAGLSGGARLEFVERLTAGAPHCRARLVVEGGR